MARRSVIDAGGNKPVFGEIELSVAPRQKFPLDVDRAKHVLSHHLKRAADRTKWSAPASVAVTLFLTLLTTDFKDGVLGVSAGSWFSITLGILAFMACLTVYFGYRAIKSKTTPKMIIEELRNGRDE